MDLILIVAGLVGLAVAALRWGVDSTDGPDSAEWERRWQWARGGTPLTGRDMLR
ncbi:MAG: hypothetical protein IT340_02755 [Chloroflexi bacterium]|nr:hypothetical protein [Chloroflexota bacterium]